MPVHQQISVFRLGPRNANKRKNNFEFLKANKKRGLSVSSGTTYLHLRSPGSENHNKVALIEKYKRKIFQ
jgi:hypothetical protein